ncbi:hypothetical protein LEP1GSC034_4084 [Leptospira interrogans str. 2003000735]|uniref:Uncharacterized protein n=2 Tax=Leptospira interrogans TaxID=173 RepID=A0A829DBU9_LEPIR|nr:hypothetical protein [Leptospira interrogans]EMY05746.1 hypothetical protein LEP1GSC029_3460 [Leptospira interrogans str. 2002000626]EMY22727.1 hypothetical protein LEP1GSC115_2026 [Leptospira interrogans serovar Australis str. 200703203]EKN90699.1 hypothetical protein LEP1GSC027_2175 [Leptospira interrogans str. 2002000624]EKQ38076.1 hypothetical protein LEP1GSC025_0692 [Leptospira interrogans str. 2002000621]EKQ46249.1 hypothetical protein LEP1GSC026_1702 [Leptospira interrogans str. 2002
MEIYINEHLIDSSLENEKKLGEVFGEVNKWVESKGKYLLSCTVDGVEFQTSIMNDQEIESVAKMEFFVGEEMDFLVSTLTELDLYVDKVGSTLFGRDSLTEKESGELSDGIKWIGSVLDSASNLLHLKLDQIKPMGTGNTVSQILAEISSNCGSLDNTETIENFLEHLRDLKLFIMDLIARTQVLDLDLPTLKEILNTFIENIGGLKEAFVKVNESYQSGKDEVAIELLTQSISQINVLLTSFITLKLKKTDLDFSEIEINGIGFEEKTGELNEILASIAVALEEKDIIRAGDSIEYELPGTLDEILPFLKLIREKIS